MSQISTVRQSISGCQGHYEGIVTLNLASKSLIQNLLC